MSPRFEVIGDCTLYLGDCREVMDGITGVDVTITDPPYGVAGGWGSGLRKGGGKTASRASKSAYGALVAHVGDDEFDMAADHPASWATKADAAISKALGETQ